MEGRSFEIRNNRGRSLIFNLANPTRYVFNSIEGQGKPNTAIFTYQSPAQHGSEFTEALLDERSITLTGHAHGATRQEMDAALLDLNLNVSPALGPLELIYTNTHGKYRIRGIASDPITYEARIAAGGRHYTPVSITFRCPDPAWYAVDLSVSDLYYFDGLFSFPFELPAAFGGSGYRQVLSNIGDLPAPINIRITGPAAKPSIINVTHGGSLTLTRPLARYEALHINTDPLSPSVELENTISKLRQDAMDYIDITTPTHDFWLMQPGLNEILYKTGDDSKTATMSVSWPGPFSGV